MNVIAAVPGWRSLAVWGMPPVAYALASDTLIGVIRSLMLIFEQRSDIGGAKGIRTPDLLHAMQQGFV